MNKPAAYWVYVTCASEDEARHIAQAAVSQRLAACANIIPGMQSMYWWEGKVQQDHETVLILKTLPEAYAKLERLIVDLHSYSVPCVLAFPVVEGNPPYLDWIRENVNLPSH